MIYITACLYLYQLVMKRIMIHYDEKETIEIKHDK